jgi:DNA-binding winged helix-turn-helix (wHTH) protein
MNAAASFEFGPFRLDPDKRVLWRGGEVVGLTPKALALLQVLVEHGGDVVPKQELMTRVWPDTVVEEANLSVTVAALRKVLGDQPDGRSYVQTVPRRGYRFVAPVRGPVSTARLTLAVLPFKDLGPQPQSHLGLGMADAVINRLATCEDLLVRPTGAVFHYADAPKSPREAGRELGVGAVVDGTVQRRGERVRVTVHVVALCPEAQPWAGSFDAESPDLFAVQDTVAERIAEALRARLRPTEKPASETSRKPNREAHEAYLRGRYFWARFDPAGIGKAFGCFGEAATLDPGYGAPHAGLAAAHVILGFSGVARPYEAWQLASECAERALASDPTLAEAHVARAYVALFRDWEWETARASLERAATLSPGAPGVHQWFGLFLAAAGDLEGAQRELARARKAGCRLSFDPSG